MNAKEYICSRRVVIVIENDTIGDGLWYPQIAEALRSYANYHEKTHGCGQFPQCFILPKGDKITIDAGTYFEEQVLCASTEGEDGETGRDQ